MRILFLAKSQPVYGGVERWLADLVAGLADAGHRCRVGLAQGRRFHDPARYAQAYPGLPWFPLEATTGSPAGRWRAASRAIRRHRPDVVVPVMLADGLAAAVRLRERLGLRIVYPVHEFTPGVKRDLALFGHALDAVVTVDALTEGLAGDTPPATVLCRATLPQGVPIPGRPPPWQPGATLQLGYAGRLEHAAKRADDLVPLARELDRWGRDWHLSVAGEGALADSLQRALEGIAPGRVTFLGARDRSRLYECFYPRIDAFLITSDWETGPLVAFEAMAHRRVVVTADFTGRRENGFLRDRENCLVYPVGDMAAAAEHLAHLAADPALGRRLADQGYRDCLAERSLDTLYRRWDALLTAVGEVPRRAGAGPNAVRPPGPTERLRELGRRWLGRSFPHPTGRGEWPNYW